MKKDSFKKDLKGENTNNGIFTNVFDACIPFLHEDSELSLELTDETAPPEMSNFKEK